MRAIVLLVNRGVPFRLFSTEYPDANSLLSALQQEKTKLIEFIKNQKLQQKYDGFKRNLMNKLGGLYEIDKNKFPQELLESTSASTTNSYSASHEKEAWRKWNLDQRLQFIKQTSKR